MRIPCPSCASVYDVPDTLLVGRRPVRCARCGHKWVPDLTAAVVAEPAPPPVVHAPPMPEPRVEAPPPRMEEPFRADPRMATTPAPRRPPVVALAWVASIALLLGLGVAAYAWRTQVAAAWPPSQRLYAGLGLQ